jgi:predicted glycogen debranching enzyme
MPELIRVLPKRDAWDPDWDPHLRDEWLVTNGLGGYASGTVSGAITRRYHGLLVAALPNPLGRMMMLNGLSERLRLPDHTVAYTGAQELSAAPTESALAVAEFRLEMGLPVWRYEVGGFVLEKRLLLPYRQNTVHLNYRLLEGHGKLRIGLRPAINFRSHDAPVNSNLGQKYVLTVIDDQFEVTSSPNLPALRMYVQGESQAFTFDRKESGAIAYYVERHRGYEWEGSLWSPGYFRTDLGVGGETTLVASTEEWDTIQALSPSEAFEAETNRRSLLIAAAVPEAQRGAGAELVLAADQFLIRPTGRVEDAARAKASGEEIRTVIAGYHWFTDWGRDTMISLEGLTLATGRKTEAAWILRTFAHYVRDGLIPNMFPEGEQEGRYHTADASLWFFHAVHRYLEMTGDQITLKVVLPQLVKIAQMHIEGTRFGISMDPSDALIRQGEEGYQLTWMDAKVGDWVVTPRRGKAVEINALWFNALLLLAGWLHEEDPAQADAFAALAARVQTSFNLRFWFERGGYLYDVVDAETGGNDESCRPNQVLAISLDYPVLDRALWQPVMDVVTARLLTSVGLRSLAPGCPEYKAKYYGDLRARDAAYHQGTVWAWLIGPYIDALLKLHPEQREDARKLLMGFLPHLNQQCIGSISEVFDADEPYTPRGCIAQAWSVAEVLRCWVKTSPEHGHR